MTVAISRVEHSIAQFRKSLDQKGYAGPHSFIKLPGDVEYRKQVKELIAKKKKLVPAFIVVVGIGGSNLGAQAVYEALKIASTTPIYFADTVDSQFMAHLLARVNDSLAQGEKLLIVTISKSGSTTETIANFECFLAVLMKHHPNQYYEQVVVISDEDSPFWKLALSKNFDVLPIPTHVGGRFSVMSAVGLFPLGMAGIDIEQLCEGAQQITHSCLELNDGNRAALFALVLAQNYAKGIRIHDLFLFDSCLESMGKWQRQLIGESLGKPNTHGEPLGITPTVSIGSTDLHSVGQLYLGGPNDRVTTFVWIEKEDERILIPNMPEFDALVPHIQSKSLHTIMAAIFEGTLKAYEKANRPFMTIVIPEKNAFYIGQFLQSQMIATVYLGVLMEVNSFDQPQVELYKQTTREILAHE
ncbi:MAG: glucose-6-phosphate isomerase [Candidatus Babeliales bacterium]